MAAAKNTAARAKRLREKLLGWYDENRRDLPWRRTRDPYAIWISETMLQQTRVETVIPYYERFLHRFPDIETLASADSQDVLRLWSGLGYYSRARNLHRAAQVVMDDWSGDLPREPEELHALPGVGRYTAGALASIAFDRPAAVLDGNVIRVLTRLFAIRDDTSANDVRERLWEEAATLAQGARPGDLNQALMELGATCCTPRSPQCSACPWRRSCAARRAGDAESLPIKRKKSKQREVAATAAWLPRRGTILAVRRPAKGLLANLWELPGGEFENGSDPRSSLRRSLRERIGLSVSRLEAGGEIEHVFTHLRLRLHLFRASGVQGRVRLRDHSAHRWIRPSAFSELPHATVMRKAFEQIEILD